MCGILAAHPRVGCLSERGDYWAAVDRRTDVCNLYSEGDAMYFMDARHASGRARSRFDRLFDNAGALPLVEWSCANACRVGFLEALAPGARYLSLVRNGVSVAHSIDKVASGPDLQIAGKPGFNPWWGLAGSAWAALARDGASSGYFAEEVGPLQTHAQRGAYQWLVSLAEADRWRHRLGPRFAEVTYTAMTAAPRETLSGICAHLGIAADSGWIAAAATSLVPERHKPDEPLRLPRRMAAAFNAQQERYRFAGRAEAP